MTLNDTLALQIHLRAQIESAVGKRDYWLDRGVASEARHWEHERQAAETMLTRLVLPIEKSQEHREG